MKWSILGAVALIAVSFPVQADEQPGSGQDSELGEEEAVSPIKAVLNDQVPRGKALQPVGPTVLVELPSPGALTPAELYSVVKNSVVVIRTDDSLGAGFLVRNRRLIATAFHVIEDGGPITVLSRSGAEYPARVYTYDEETDLAVLELSRDFEDAVVLPLRVASDLGVGEPVVMVGHPFGDYAETIDDLEGLLTWTITAGIVGAVSERFVQTDAASSPGNSGGPILDMHGRVLGVVSRRLDGAEGLTFSVPSLKLERLLNNPGTPPELKPQPVRKFGVGISRFSTSNDLWMDGVFLSLGRAPRGMGSRWGFQLGYNTVNEVPEQSGLFHFSEDLYWIQGEGGVRLPVPFSLGSLDPFLGARVGWHRREILTLFAATADSACDPTGDEPCELNVQFSDSGERGFTAQGIAGISWNGDLGMIGGGVMLNPAPGAEPRVRWASWAAIWF